MKRILFSSAVLILFTVSSVAASSNHIHFIINLMGENSVPPVTTSATGTGTLSLSEDLTTLKYHITIEGLTPSAAHFHNSAFDTTGPIVKTLDFSGGLTISGTWSNSDPTESLTPELVTELLAGRIYLNIHTAANTSGEIRGNAIGFFGGSVFLGGYNEVPPVTTEALGNVIFVIVGVQRQLLYSVNVEGLTPTGSHFHGGAAGVNGPILIPFELINNHADSGFAPGGSSPQEISDSLITEFLIGNVYVNIHTSDNPGGELRGQLNLEQGLGASLLLDGEQEVPSVSTAGTGTGFLMINNDKTTINYDITISGINPDSITAAHFHNAPFGSNGGIVKDITFVGGHADGAWTTSDSTQPLTADLVNELLASRIYVNVHTLDNPAGEIRGQAGTLTGFTAQLEGDQAVPTVTTTASGTASMFLFLGQGADLNYNITVNGLSITAAHFHGAALGENGPILKTIDFNGNSVEGHWSYTDSIALTDSIVTELLAGNIYINIHTTANPSGEIRGQILSGIGTPIIGVEDEQRIVPNSFSLRQNYPNPFNPRTMIEYTLPNSVKVLLTVYNLLGEEVTRLIDKRIPAGVHQVTWDASNIASGMYFYKLQAGDFVRTRKMVLLK
ncbi:MAG: CHRD domain-containing protein [Candidatus Marinimicrobia bacterium]|nr:CHRD domain-containing protein [Candidatus Neomarinimicrobiota bacterium]